MESEGTHELRSQLVLGHKQAERAIALLEEERAAIEQEAGEPLEWVSGEGVRKRRILTSRSADLANRDAWPEYHEWLAAHLDRFYEVFRGRVKALDLVSDEEGVSE